MYVYIYNIIHIHIEKYIFIRASLSLSLSIMQCFFQGLSHVSVFRGLLCTVAQGSCRCFIGGLLQKGLRVQRFFRPFGLFGLRVDLGVWLNRFQAFLRSCGSEAAERLKGVRRVMNRVTKAIIAQGSYSHNCS